MSNDLIIGWELIAALTPYQTDTVVKKYGQEMLNTGTVFKSYLTSAKKVTVWSYKHLVIDFFSKKQATSGQV